MRVIMIDFIVGEWCITTVQLEILWRMQDLWFVARGKAS